METLQQAFLIFISPITTNYGWIIGIVLYCLIKLYREREAGKVTVRRWTDTTNDEMLRILYPSWFEVIRESIFRLIASAVFFIFVYCALSRVVLSLTN